MSRLLRCAIVFVSMSMALPAVRAAESVDLLLVLAADVSRSVDAKKFQLQRDGYAAAVANPRVLDAIRHDYPRAQDLPGPGFAAGPCLLKDTMQLSAFSPDHFPMGQAAMQINEGLPNYIVDTLNSRRPLQGRTVGILGMAFKGESDDPRASLSYKVRKLAAFKGARVICTDPFIDDPSFESLDKVLSESDVLVIAAPHRAYRTLELDGREVVDIWGITGPIRL